MSRYTPRKKIGPRGLFTGPVIFCLLFFAYYISPRSIFSLIGVQFPSPPQLGPLILSIVIVLVLLAQRNCFQVDFSRQSKFIFPLVMGSAGLIWTFIRSWEATGWSRPTLDLASMLLLLPLAFMAGLLTTQIHPQMAWIFLVPFVLQFFLALLSGPNSQGSFAFHSVHAIEFGLMMGTAVLLSLWLHLSSRSWYLVLPPTLFLAAVLVAHSRGALIATLVGVTILLALHIRSFRNSSLRGFATISFMVPSAWGLSHLVEKTTSPMESVISYGLLRADSSGRSRLWPAVLEKAPDGLAVVWGSGDAYVSLREDRPSEHPHNLLLAYGVTGGLLALILVLGLIAVSFFATLAASRSDKTSILLAAVLALWLIHLQFNGNFGDGANLFLIAGFALGRVARLRDDLFRQETLAGRAPNSER